MQLAVVGGIKQFLVFCLYVMIQPQMALEMDPLMKIGHYRLEKKIVAFIFVQLVSTQNVVKFIAQEMFVTFGVVSNIFTLLEFHVGFVVDLFYINITCFIPNANKFHYIF